MEIATSEYWTEFSDQLKAADSGISKEMPSKRTFRGSAADYVGLLVSDRTRAEKAIVTQILKEIATREEIAHNLSEKVDSDILKCENLLLEIETITESRELGREDELRFGSRRTTLEMKLLDLEAEKRVELVAAWKDTSNLRRYLLFSLKDYWAAARRAEIVRLGR